MQAGRGGKGRAGEVHRKGPDRAEQDKDVDVAESYRQTGKLEVEQDGLAPVPGPSIARGSSR